MEGHPITMSGSTNLVDSADMRQHQLEGHPITVSGGSIMGSGPISVQGYPITVSGGATGSIMGSGPIHEDRSVTFASSYCTHAYGYLQRCLNQGGTQLVLHPGCQYYICHNSYHPSNSLFILALMCPVLSKKGPLHVLSNSAVL